MYFFVWLVFLFFLGGSGGVCGVVSFLFVFFVLFNYPGFGAVEGPVPREEKEGEHQPFTRFGGEGLGLMGRFAGRETRRPVGASFHHFLCFLLSAPLLPPDLGITPLNVFGIGSSYASVCPSAKPLLSKACWLSSVRAGQAALGHMVVQEGGGTRWGASIPGGVGLHSGYCRFPGM